MENMPRRYNIPKQRTRQFPQINPVGTSFNREGVCLKAFLIKQYNQPTKLPNHENAAGK
jgi:hypothetical protein